MKILEQLLRVVVGVLDFIGKRLELVVGIVLGALVWHYITTYVVPKSRSETQKAPEVVRVTDTVIRRQVVKGVISPKDTVINKGFLDFLRREKERFANQINEYVLSLEEAEKLRNRLMIRQVEYRRDTLRVWGDKDTVLREFVYYNVVPPIQIIARGQDLYLKSGKRAIVRVLMPIEVKMGQKYSGAGASSVLGLRAGLRLERGKVYVGVYGEIVSGMQGEYGVVLGGYLW